MQGLRLAQMDQKKNEPEVFGGQGRPVRRVTPGSRSSTLADYEQAVRMLSFIKKAGPGPEAASSYAKRMPSIPRLDGLRAATEYFSFLPEKNRQHLWFLFIKGIFSD